MGDAAIEIEDLHVVRGGRPVLDDVSLHVASGSVTGLLGPSGCGKSTLMRAIVGVQIVAGGRVSVLGDLAGTPELRRRVGYVTQAPSVYGDLSVSENLRYFAAVVGVGQERIDALARATSPRPLGREMAVDVCVILGATLVALALGALALRRRPS